jgi:hypothetical protein
LLAKEQTTVQILFISIAVVSATRVTAYYSEELARDMAKLIPFALLGLTIVQPGFFSIELTLARIAQVPSLLWNIIPFILYIFVLEIALRVLYLVKIRLMGEGTPK